MGMQNNLKIIITIVITVAIALISGGGVYFWQKSVYQKEKIVLQQRMDSLQQEFNTLKNQFVQSEGLQAKPSMQESPEIKLPDMLSFGGVDSSGRKLSLEFILINPQDTAFELGLGESGEIIHYFISQVTKYILETPSGVLPRFIIEEPLPPPPRGPTGRQDYIIDVPEDKDIIAISATIENSGDTRKDLEYLDSKIHLIVGGQEVEPFFKPSGYILPQSRLEKKFLFRVEKGVKTARLIYGGQTESPAGVLELDFRTRRYNKAL